jgi:aryl-alcohol dehydrogenase-like predicted oxidoreductase
MPELPTRPFGKLDPQVTAIGFGAICLTAFYGKPMPAEDRFKVLDRVYELGERFWDTSDSYFDNEDLLGTWFKSNSGKREGLFLATKFRFLTDEAGNTVVRTDPQYVARLGVNYIDIH